jgi:hypothetical protein
MPAGSVHHASPSAVGLHAEADLVFDYDAVLGLARRLWAAADEVEGAMASRLSLAAAAERGFAGRYADQFRGRLGDEGTNAAHLAAALRRDAELCARAWKTAMDEQNHRLWARHVQALKKQRNLLQEAWDHLFGPGFPPEPGGVAPPQPPGFAPTAELVRYPPVTAGR